MSTAIISEELQHNHWNNSKSEKTSFSETTQKKLEMYQSALLLTVKMQNSLSFQNKFFALSIKYESEGSQHKQRYYRFPFTSSKNYKFKRCLIS